MFNLHTYCSGYNLKCILIYGTDFNVWALSIKLSIYYSLGGPLDLMSRRVVCASCPELAQALSKELKHIQMPRD